MGNNKTHDLRLMKTMTSAELEVGEQEIENRVQETDSKTRCKQKVSVVPYRSTTASNVVFYFI